MIAFEPDFRDRTEPMVGRDQFRRKMAMIIDDRKIFRDLVIKTFGDFRFQQEVFMGKWLHEIRGY